MSTLMEKIICKLKYCLDIFFGGNSSILCPAETLQISRLFGVPACVSTSQPNKTSHNQWNKHVFGRRRKKSSSYDDMGLVLVKVKTFSKFFCVSVGQGDFKKELQKVG